MSKYKKRAFGQLNEAENKYNNAYLAARDQATQGYNEAQGALSNTYAQTSEAYNPYIEGGRNAYSMLEDLLGVPREGVDAAQAKQRAQDTLRNMPGYAFRVNQANDQLQRLAAKNGMSYSGNELADMAELNQGLADQSYQGALASYGNLAFNPMVQSGINNMGQYGEDMSSLLLNKGLYNSNLTRENANTMLGLGQMRAQLAGTPSGRGGSGIGGALAGLAGSVIGSAGGPIGAAIGKQMGNWAGNKLFGESAATGALPPRVGGVV